MCAHFYGQVSKPVIFRKNSFRNKILGPHGPFLICELLYIRFSMEIGYLLVSVIVNIE